MHNPQNQTSSQKHLIEHAFPSISHPHRKPSGAWLVGCLFFSALSMLVFAASAFALLGFDGDEKALPLAVWNCLIALGSVGVAVGCWRRDSWSFPWATGTASIQAVSIGIAAFGSNVPPPAKALLYLGAAFALVALVAIQLARDDFDPAAETAPEEGGLLHHPRRPNPSGIITFALLLITGLLHLLAQP